MENHSLTSASQSEAARAYAPYAAKLDPTGEGSPESWAAFGRSFELRTPTGRAIFSIDTSCEGGALCWIDAAAGTGEGMTERGLPIIEQQARVAGCSAVAFQTLRRGLVRRVQRLGYRIAGTVGRGFILRKTIA